MAKITQKSNYSNLEIKISGYHSHQSKDSSILPSTLAWKIPWTEKPGGLQSMGSRRVGHDWVTSLSLFTFHFHALEKEMATLSSILAWRIPGTEEPSGLLSMGSHRVGHDWSDLAAARIKIFSSYSTLAIKLDTMENSSRKKSYFISIPLISSCKIKNKSMKSE